MTASTLAELCRFFEEQIPFNRVLGLRVARLERGFARLEIPYRDELIGDPVRPALHGGVISALVDTCGGAAVWSDIEPGDRVSTIDLRVDYLLPGEKATLVAEGRVVRTGNHVGVVDVRCFHTGPDGDRADRLIAAGKGVYSIRRA